MSSIGVVFQFGTFLFSIITFLILFWIIAKVGFKPLARMFEQRRLYVETQLGEAEANRAQAEQFLAEQREALEHARKQALDTMEAARKRADEQAREIVAAAQAEATRLLEENRRMIARERDEAMAEVLGRVSDLTVQISEKLLRKHVTQAVHDEMVKEAEKQLGELVC
ncbi:MAG: F0F1 ATP synthase subunit B [Firmicutes bacterium]|nr:F0F1 ATP synthase subunit B [Bacillota bacterium]